VLDGVDLEIQKGEFVTIFGPNGCGKSTLLDIVGGLEQPTAGDVQIAGESASSAKIGMVFQHYNESLFPWRTALQNVAFPLELKGASTEESTKTAAALLEKVGLAPHTHKYPSQLSGGMKQLVAICRAIAHEPDVLLLDEPFSALDYSTTRKMELALLDMWMEKKITTLFVSHDVDEAIFLADRVVVLSQRPARVKKIVPIDLPRPRTLDMFTSEEFGILRKKVLDAFTYE